MPSAFYQMFQYAKSTQAEARENFTTEALAGAIRCDLHPLLGALCTKGILQDVQYQLIEVATQTKLSCGQIDLIVVVKSNNDISQELWLEIKVDSGLSGNQISNYLDYIQAFSASQKPILLTLAKNVLDTRIPNLLWEELSAQIDEEQSFYWQEFKRFLQEIRMVKRPIKIVPEAEVESVLRQFAKDANSHLRALWPHLMYAFPEGSNVRAEMDKTLRESQKLTISIQMQSWSQIVAGVNNEGYLGVWVLNKLAYDRRRQWNLRQRIIEQAVELDKEIWRTYEQHDWIALEAITPYENVQGSQSSHDWLMEQFREICKSSIPLLIHMPEPDKGNVQGYTQ